MTAEQRKKLERVLDSLCYRYAIGRSPWKYERARLETTRKIEKILKVKA